jgi:hypothetical protein
MVALYLSWRLFRHLRVFALAGVLVAGGLALAHGGLGRIPRPAHWRADIAGMQREVQQAVQHALQHPAGPRR